MSKKKKKRKPRPPCPDPEKYTWVSTKDGGGYWRHNRGTFKEATLNSVLQLNADITRETNEAAKSVMDKLRPFLEHLMIGRTVSRIAGAFKKAILQHGSMDYTFLQGYDFQNDYPFNDLANGLLLMKEENGSLYLRLPVGILNVKKFSKLATGYCVEAILLFGDPGNVKSLRIDSTPPQPYSFSDERKEIDCLLSIELPPKQPWMVLLRINCQGKYVQIEQAAKYHALKVVKVGRGS